MAAHIVVFSLSLSPPRLLPSLPSLPFSSFLSCCLQFPSLFTRPKLRQWQTEGVRGLSFSTSGPHLSPPRISRGDTAGRWPPFVDLLPPPPRAVGVGGPAGRPWLHPPSELIPCPVAKRHLSRSQGAGRGLGGRNAAPKICPQVRGPEATRVRVHAADFWFFFPSPQNWGTATGESLPGPHPEGFSGTPWSPPPTVPSQPAPPDPKFQPCCGKEPGGLQSTYRWPPSSLGRGPGIPTRGRGRCGEASSPGPVQPRRKGVGGPQAQVWAPGSCRVLSPDLHP